jgi:Ankyrin repeats (3 copies)
VPLLLQQGVDPLALDASGRTALQLACVQERHSSAATAKALLLAHTDSSNSSSSSSTSSCMDITTSSDNSSSSSSSSGSSSGSSSSSSSSNSSSITVPMPAEMATACLLCAVAAGHADILTALLEHGCDPSGPVDTANHTLLHVAAAWGRADCLGLLLQQGLSVHAKSDSGSTPLDMIASIEVPESLHPEPLESGKRYIEGMENVGLLLMQHGAALNEELSDIVGYYKTIVEKYVQWLRQQVATRDTTLSAHCSSARSAAMSHISDQHCTDTALAVTTVRVQLVHADTGERGSYVYTLDTAVLAQLHTACGETSVSVLSTLVAPPQGWRSAVGSNIAATTAASTAIRLLPYDGEPSYNYFILSLLFSCCSKLYICDGI